MAKAPKPGSARKRERRRIEITLDGKLYALSLEDINTNDRLAVRSATGMPPETFLGQHTFGPDSLAVLLFLARRKAGEWGLQWRKHEKWWDEIMSELTEDRISVEVVDENDGPEEEEGADPLG